MDNVQSLLEALHTVFVIVYLQEVAWIFTPLIISLNVLLHSFLNNMDYATQWLSISVTLFFLITGICIAVGLYLIHKMVLCAHRVKYLLPYVIFKLIRTTVLVFVASVILARPDLRSRYFHISLYSIVESVSNLVAIEICYRSWKYIERANRRKRLGTTEPTVTQDSRISVARLKRSESLQERRELIAKI
ncbi:unnamed protein product [Anisakis simplex]|uniref:Transmembrane protein 138 n=1 Tax=Anisakis simplex TaxID=6269 RepID=A0A0M3IYJ9_ANISI|nr:unnamed protein product [Anisakis simplex]